MVALECARDHGGINCPGVKKQGTNRGLEQESGMRGEQRRAVVRYAGLLGLAVGRFAPFVGSIDRSGWLWMFQAIKKAVDVSGHRNVDITVGIVPIKMQTTVVFAVPVNGNLVELAKSMDKMVGIRFAVILYSKIIDAETKQCLAGDMLPHTDRMGNWIVSMCSQVGLQLLIS